MREGCSRYPPPARHRDGYSPVHDEDIPAEVYRTWLTELREQTTTTPPARPAAQALRATYRADGVVLLELIEDWSTALGRAEVPADDERQLRELLTDWALRPTVQRGTRRAGRRTSAEETGTPTSRCRHLRD